MVHPPTHPMYPFLSLVTHSPFNFSWVPGLPETTESVSALRVPAPCEDSSLTGSVLTWGEQEWGLGEALRTCVMLSRVFSLGLYVSQTRSLSPGAGPRLPLLWSPRRRSLTRLGTQWAPHKHGTRTGWLSHSCRLLFVIPFCCCLHHLASRPACGLTCSPAPPSPLFA